MTEEKIAGTGEPLHKQVDIHLFPYVLRWQRVSPKEVFEDFLARQNVTGVDVAVLNGQVTLMTELAILYCRVERWHEVIARRHKTQREPYLRRWYSPDELKCLERDIRWIMCRLNRIT